MERKSDEITMGGDHPVNPYLFPKVHNRFVVDLQEQAIQICRNTIRKVLRNLAWPRADACTVGSTLEAKQINLGQPKRVL